MKPLSGFKLQAVPARARDYKMHRKQWRQSWKKGRSFKALKHAKLQTKELVPLAVGTLKPVGAVPHLLGSNKVHLYSKLFLPVTNVGCARYVKNQQECLETELASISLNPKVLGTVYEVSFRAKSSIPQRDGSSSFDCHSTRT